MRLTHIAFHIGLACVAMISDALVATISLIERFVDSVLDLFPAEPKMVLAGGFGRALDQPGQSLDPALRQSMRHESRTSRIGSPRHT